MKGVIGIGYEREQIDELCSRLDLLGYIEQSYDLKCHGDEYSMHCPLHKDNTPSMFINAKKGRFYCHSCRASGTILDWLIKVEGLTFLQAVEKLKKLTGADITPTVTASSYSFFKSMARISTTEDKAPERQILPESYFDQFELPAEGEPHEWLAEGISPEMIRKYGIRIDRAGNRIIYPVRDNDGNLIGAKGRTRFKEYKLLGIKKYLNYTRIGTTDFFQGMYENRESILQAAEIIIFESIKSVMLADGWGYPNCVAAETSLINDAQAKILIKMGIKDVVLAFDSDVPAAEIKKSADKLHRWMNVWVVKDKNGNPGDKLAPVDEGEKKWKELYEGMTRYV